LANVGLLAQTPTHPTGQSGFDWLRQQQNDCGLL